MDIHEKFSTFCSNILIDSSTVSNISYRYKRITRQLNRDFWDSESDVYHSLYVGSYGRDTDTHVSDIDILFWLPYKKYLQYNSHQGNGQSALLQDVKTSIQRTYKSYMRADGQVVKVDFTDGVSFEIVPCFVNDNASFTYPDTNNGGSWKVTNPKPEIRAIKETDQNVNSNLKRLCRMARLWKDTWDVPMGGLLIDTLAHNFINQWDHKYNSFYFYDWMTRDFFEYLKDQNINQRYWYAPGSSQYVWRKGNFEYKALRCYNISLEAIKHETAQRHWSANQEWRKIYGTKFPS